MSIPTVTQLGLVTVVGSPQPPTIPQLALISLQAPPDIPPQVTQAVLILPIANRESFLNLANVIGLNCWSPCTNYGTQAKVIFNGDCDK